ncbi:MAG: outer membrane lipoprotein carrier protein LolA [Nitrospirae bacterium]|nr:outer membrane lipoprotein carrier protein LolA [Nitrospirota bacterium]
MTRLLALLACLLLAPPAFAAGDAAEAGLARLIGAYQGVERLTADFTQETTYAGFSTARAFGGRLELVRPDRMRWDYRNGSDQQIYVAGREVTVYAPAQQQAIVSTLSHASDQQIPLHLLADVTGIPKTYHVAAGTDPGELVLTPLADDPRAPTAVHLWLHPETGLIRRVRLLLPGGSRSDIAFTNVDTGAAINDARFRFAAPKGVHVARPEAIFPKR